MLKLQKENLFGQLVQWVFIIFFGIFPFLNYSSFLYFPSSTRSINLILVANLLGLILGLLLFKKENRVGILKSSFGVSIILYFLWLFVPAIFSGNFGVSFYSNITRTTGLWYFIALAIFFLLAVVVFKDEKKRDTLLIVSSVAAALFSILATLSPSGFGILFKGNTMDGFTLGNSTFAAMYLLANFFFASYLFASKKLPRFVSSLLLILIVINPFFLNIAKSEAKGLFSFIGVSRASAFALIVSLVGFLYVFLISKIKNNSLRTKIAYGTVLASIVVICVVAVSLFSENGVVRKFYLSQATGARVLVWESSEKLIKEKPLLGYGKDNFEKTFELNYDSRIMEERYGAETWFDRSHNIFIDETFENGAVGIFLYILVYIFAAFSLLKVALQSSKKENRVLASLLLVYLGAHLIELQTGFDTSISFPFIALILALVVVLHQEEKDGEKEYILPLLIKYIFAGVLFLFSVWSLLFKVIPFIDSGIVNGEIRAVGNSAKRTALYPRLFATPVDLQAVLWRTWTDFERGISEHPEILSDAKKVEGLKAELAIFEKEYKEYTDKNPRNFRALLNYADIKIYYMLLGEDKLGEAQEVLGRAIALVPEAPQPYWMKAVAYLYAQKFKEAKEWADKGLQVNPEVPGSQDLKKYIDESIKNFPEIDLYFFKQI